MDINNITNKIQNKSTAFRSRLLIFVAVLIAILLATIWVWTSAGQIKGIDKDDLAVKPEDMNQANSEKPVLTKVEWVEHVNGTIKIYFKVINPTDDILGFSKESNITFFADGKTTPTGDLTDRQGGPFAQKILSHTEQYGVAAFPDTNAPTGKILFENMFYEKDSLNYFKETYDLDLNALNKKPEFRS